MIDFFRKGLIFIATCIIFIGFSEIIFSLNAFSVVQLFVHIRAVALLPLLTIFRAVGHGELCTNFWLAIRLLYLLLPDWIVNTVLWSYHDPYSLPLNRYELALHVPNVAKTMKVAEFKVIGRSLHRYIWSFYLIVGS